MTEDARHVSSARKARRGGVDQPVVRNAPMARTTWGISTIASSVLVVRRGGDVRLAVQTVTLAFTTSTTMTIALSASAVRRRAGDPLPAPTAPPDPGTVVLGTIACSPLAVRRRGGARPRALSAHRVSTMTGRVTSAFRAKAGNHGADARQVARPAQMGPATMAPTTNACQSLERRGRLHCCCTLCEFPVGRQG